MALRWNLTSFSGDWEFQGFMAPRPVSGQALRPDSEVAQQSAGGLPIEFHFAGWNQTMAHIASVLKPHGVGLGNAINSGCIVYSESTKDGIAKYDPTCAPASRDVPWAGVLTDMYSYSFGGRPKRYWPAGYPDRPEAWSKNGTRGSCPGYPFGLEDPVTEQYCGWEGPIMNTLHSPIATVHPDRAPQLSPGLYLGNCFANGTSSE